MYYVKDFCDADNERRYYILVDADSGTSELFGGTENQILPLSNSKLKKSNLSCDQTSGRATFIQEGTEERRQVAVWDPGTESTLITSFSAVRAHLLAGGSSLVLINEQNVSVASAEGNEAEVIFNEVIPQHVSIDPQGRHASVFNRLTMQIDTFELLPGGQPTYISSSETLSAEPVFIQYLGEEVFGVYRSDDSFRNGFYVQNVSGGSDEAQTYQSFSPIHFPSMITTWYE